MNKKKLVTVSFIAFHFFVYGQEKTLKNIFKVDYETPLTIELKELDSTKNEVEAPKKKVKRNVFFDLKTKKRFIKSRIRNKRVYEYFYVLKTFEPPPKFTRDFYWYDRKKKKIVNSLKIKKEYAKVLNGPYKKKLGDVILEEGWYYKGMKHRRWVKHNQHDILQNKQYWWKGWPQESLLSYWDYNREMLKEVISVHFGDRNGKYWVFHPNGSVAVIGQYKHNYKVGIWREYYQNNKVKREMIFSDNPFDIDFISYISKEWDENGTLIYENESFKKIGISTFK